MIPRSGKLVVSSIRFGMAGILSAIMTVLALCLIVAKNRNNKDNRNSHPVRRFLAEKHRALDFYRVFSATYDVLNPPFYTKEMRSQILSPLNEGAELRVLDVGCGTGYTTRGILEHKSVCEVVGLDLNPVQLGKAIKNMRVEKNRAFLYRGDAENLPFLDDTFDAVVSVGAIEYFPDPTKAVSEMRRVVKPSCLVVVGGPELVWFRRIGLDKFFYTPSEIEMNAIFSKANLRREAVFLTGIHTVFGTGEYVVIAVGRKSSSFTGS